MGTLSNWKENVSIENGNRLEITFLPSVKNCKTNNVYLL